MGIKMNKRTTKTWQQYQAGKTYKQQIGLYENIRKNERFYRGDHWYGVSADDLPKPVFNIIRRIVDFLVASVGSGKVNVSFCDECLPFVGNTLTEEAIREGVQALSANFSYRWDRCKMDKLLNKLLSDAAITGDGVLYSYWNAGIKTGQAFLGDIVTEVIENSNLFAADMNNADIQGQEYVILSGRQSVSSLKDEALRYGVNKADALCITADNNSTNIQGDLSPYELEGDEEAKATYLIKFWREDGLVCFEKSTESTVIRRGEMGTHLYPVAYFNWFPTKNSFHGTSPISGLIPNQKYINKAFAMVMKHMTDTAFSKVIYDKSKIPEWSNEVGEAIASLGGGNVSDAVSVVGVGQMQENYLELIKMATSMTKEFMGATDVALGNTMPTNTSAILALRQATDVPLMSIRTAYYQCIEDMANIYADMMCVYYPNERFLSVFEEGKFVAKQVDFKLLRQALLCAKVEVSDADNYSSVSTQSLLDRLLEGGHITARQYIEFLPKGALSNRKEIIATLDRDSAKGERSDGE